MSGRVLSAKIDPARGGKIVSLRDARGTEWLTQRDPNRVVRPGGAFIEAEMAGWDECAPTIVACRVGDHDLPDHGDLWEREFEVEPDGITMTAIGSSLGYRLTRKIQPISRGLTLEYEVQALERPIPFLWAAHPQFAAPPGTRVELPGVERVVDVMDVTLPELAWTDALSTIDTVEAGEYRKVYAHPEAPVQRARLVRSDSSALTMTWTSACPYVGVWFDAMAYSREPVIAIEPTTSYFDALDTAVRLDRAPIVHPGEPLRWALKIIGEGGSF